VETVVLAVLAFALEYLRRKAEAERFRAKMKAAQPEIETAVSALDPEIEALQRSSSGRTVWVHVTIWITSRDTVMGGMGFMTYDHAFEDAGFERASASLQYVNGRTSTLGRPVSVPFEGGSATSTLRRELVTTSVPVAYNTATLDAAERLHRIQRIEADAKQPDLPSSVLQALFNERDAMKSAGLP
jgi:hypothetical protein